MRRWSLIWKLLVPTLTAMGISAALLLSLFGRSSRQNIVASQVADAKATIFQFKALRAYYTANVVAKLKPGIPLQASFDHAGRTDAIPLPASMIHDMSKILGQDSSGIFLRLYSNHPFPNRKDRVLDGFMREALERLSAAPGETFVK